MSSPSWISILSQFVFVVPPVIAYAVGLVLAFQRKRSHPYSAGLAIWGFLLLMTETIFFSCVRNVLLYDRGGIGLSMSNYGLLFSAIGVLQTIFFTLGIGLLIGAIFSDRGPRPAGRRRGEPDDFDAFPPRTSGTPVQGQSETSYRDKRDS